MIRRLFTASTLAATLIALAACTSNPTPPDSSAPQGRTTPTPDPAPVVKVVSDATPGQPLQLEVTGGEFVSVELTDADHAEVPADTGTYAPSGAPSDSATDSSATDEATDDAATNTTAEDETDTPVAGGDLTESNATSAPDTTGAGTEPTSTAPSTTAPSATATDTNPKGTHWESVATLAGSANYTWTATTISPDGKTHESTGEVETDAPKGSGARLSSILGDDANVGVGAPIILNFESEVPKKYRAGIEQRLSVEVTDKNNEPRDVEGSWAWLPDDSGHSRIHFRPKEFWPEFSKVHMSAPVKNVPFSDTTFGAKDLTLDINIDREQMVVADAKEHTMKVTRDGKTIMDFPASLGAPRSPSFNGMHIVMSKALNYTMTSDRWGYSTPVTHAVRIHNNGEFIHAAPWSVGSQGNANVSHGCVNLSTANAAEYYKTAIFGDPVEIVGSDHTLTTSSGDISDWVYTWDEWKDLSALPA